MKRIPRDFLDVISLTMEPIPRAVEISHVGGGDNSIVCGLRGFSVVNYARYADWYIDNVYTGSSHISANSSTWGQFRFDGLQSGTEYKITAYLYKSSNDELLIPPITRYISTTGTPPEYTPPTINTPTYSFPSHGCTNSSTITFSSNIYDYGSGLRSVYMQFNGVGETFYNGGNKTYSKTFNTPSVAGTYQLGISAVDNSGNKSERYFDYYITYDVTPPKITAYSAELDTSSGFGILVSAQATDNASGVHQFAYRISLKNNSSGWGDWLWVDASSPRYTFNNDGYGYPIEGGNTYYIEYKAVDRANNYTPNAIRYSYYVAYSKPSPWYWTQAELDAFSKNGAITTLTRQRWNAFVARVGEFDKWKNGTGAGQYYLGDAEIPSIKDPSYVLTAYRFNTVRHAVGSMYSGGSGIDPNDIMTGKPVKGSYFTTLSNRLNSIT